LHGKAKTEKLFQIPCSTTASASINPSMPKPSQKQVHAPLLKKSIFPVTNQEELGWLGDNIRGAKG